MKIFKFISRNILLFITFFLLAFIPLYPKLPLVDIKNTWVYIRFDDVAVSLTLLLWAIMVLTRKIKLKTPLTFSIFLFWLIGALSTIHGVLILFPMLSNVFSNVAFLSFIRRIEYMSLFFVAYCAIKERKNIYPAIWVLLATLLAVVVYGFGQKIFGLPAFLTMNEEFAKGVPITLSQLSRIPSTFGGQYDLAAYLVLVVPIIFSMFFGFRNWFIKILLAVSAVSGFALLFTTVSRISFFAIVVSLAALLILQRKIWVIISLFFMAALLLILSPSLLARFDKTVTPVNVLVDTASGGAIGEVRQVDKSYFKDKLVLFSGTKFSASKSATLDYKDIPDKAEILLRPDTPNGETLPQGTAYINLPLSPILTNTNMYFVENPPDSTKNQSVDAYVYSGKYLVKKARAYDLSFTTRFQGEWPNTLLAFKRNVFFGSGYGSVSLAVDNDYLRLLGESGIVGFLSFLSIFIVAGIYIKKTLPRVDSKIVRSFVLGFVAGTLGLAINGTLIDVFEASKVAFSYWILMGICLGILNLYSRDIRIDLLREFKKAIVSPFALVLYVLISGIALFLASYNYYFVGDDFTWLRWAAQTSSVSSIAHYFTNANGFFYRPGTMSYFYFMYSAFWLNQSFYHLISVSLHILASVLLFFVLWKIIKNYSLSIISAFLFLGLSGHHEAIFWISSTGFLFNAVFTLLSLLFFIYWKEKKNKIYLTASLISIFLSLMFHEVGVVAPLLIISYDLIFSENFKIKKLFKKSYFVILSPLLPYLFLRLIASSHWFSGDYSYNLVKLPFNLIGNLLGYLSIDLFGPVSLRFYEILRDFSKNYVLFLIPVFVFIIFAVYVLVKKTFNLLDRNEQRIILFALAFFIISLLPFLGLGNITSRYSYLSSMGFVLLLAFFVKKIYLYILDITDKYIAPLVMVILVMIFVIGQLFQLQQLHMDWQSGGEVSKRALISVQGIYSKNWIDKQMHFYFVDVPIMHGQAWVFPVGFKDALWFSLKNKDFTVDMMPDLPTAVDTAKNIENAEIFQLDQNGNIVKYISVVSDYIKSLE